MDDAFTILDRENVDDFLQHLNNQQPSIHFTMETEEDYKTKTKPSVISEEKRHLSSFLVSNGYLFSF